MTTSTYRVMDSDAENGRIYQGNSALEAVKSALYALDTYHVHSVDVYRNEHLVYSDRTDDRGKLFSILSTQETVGDNIAAARRAAELSQQDLADKTGLRQATIADIETGKSDCRISTLQAIAVALDCDIADLFE